MNRRSEERITREAQLFENVKSPARYPALCAVLDSSLETFPDLSEGLESYQMAPG
jgi:hypothetical protein